MTGQPNTGKPLPVTVAQAIKNKLNKPIICVDCGGKIHHPKPNKYFCDNACKQRNYRKRA